MSNINTNSLVESLAMRIIGQDLRNRDPAKNSPSVELQTLEDRVLYSAGPLPIDVAQPIDIAGPGCDVLDCFESIETQFAIAEEICEAYDFSESATEVTIEAPFDAGFDLTATEDARSKWDPTNELVIVDTSVEGYDQLVNELLSQQTNDRSFEVVYLSSTAEGIGQISSILGARANLDAIHLVSHGQDGELRLGESVINGDNLGQFESEISNWRHSLNADADVLIYGCNVVETEVGESFIERLSELMDADFSASSDVTGHVSLGGDWDFEFQVGTVEANVAFSVSVQQDWDGSLGNVVTADPTDAILDDTSGEGRGSQQAVAMDDNGNYVVVWSSNGNGSVGWDVSAQRYDDSGIAVGPVIAVNQNATGDQQWASVAMDANGNFVVTWTDDSDNEVNYRRFEADGDPITGELRVNNPASTGTASGSTIAMNSSGDFVITWVGQGMGDQKEIYASAFDADGSVILDNFIVNTTTIGDQLSPGVSINDSGNFVISWHDGDGVYAQKFDANGSANGTEIDVESNSNIFVTVVNDFSSVALQDDNSFAVLYQNTTGGNPGPDVRLYDATGGFIGSGDDNQTVTNIQSDSSIQVGADGTYILVWEGYGNQTGEFDDDGVFARLIDASGNAITDEFRVNDYTTGSQNNISVAINDQNSYVFVYSGESATDSQGVFSILVTPVNIAPTLGDESTSIDEDASINDLVIDLTATDPDDVVFVYQIVGGNVGGAFAIDSDSGEITVANTLDFETRSSYVLQVTATDGLGEVDSANISIAIGNVSEPTISGTIYEDAVGDGAVLGDAGVAGVTVILYQDDGDSTPDAGDSVVSSTTTNGLGAYQFNELPDGDYYVVVDSRTITPTAGFNIGFGIGDVWAQQTYGFNSASFGGVSVNLADDASSITTAEHLNFVSVSGGLVAGVDFGFSFNVVTNLLGGDIQDDDLGNNRTVQGSLRQFIQNANAINGDNTMRFVPMGSANETSVGGDWWSIAISVALPEITDEGTTLDGRAFQNDGVTVRNDNGNILGFSGTVGAGADGVVGTGDDAILVAHDAPELEIYDAAGLGAGVVISASNVEVSNFAIHGFGDSQNDGGNIYVDGTSSSVTNVTIRDNVLGSTADVFASPVSGADQSRNITVREADAGVIQDNLIGFAGLSGVLLSGSSDATDGANGWQIIRNEIRDNGRSVANRDGINVILGSGSTTVSQNLIINNAGFAVDAWKTVGGHSITENTITGNGHGGQETGGIRLFGTSSSVQFNVISDNTGPGVHVIGQYDDGIQVLAASTGNLISRNSFSGNTGVAIDLSDASTNSTIFTQGDGSTSNDGILDSTSGNGGLDHPTLTSAHVEGDGLHLFGVLDGSFATRDIELYIADSGAGDYVSGIAYGEGSTYLATLNLSNVLAYDATTGAFEVLLATPVGGWPTEMLTGSVTGIAIDTVSNNTSEFSNVEEVELGWRPVITTGQDLYIDEGNKAVGEIQATDPDGDDIQFSITGGVDENLFRINRNNGKLRFNHSPDFEAPADSGPNSFDNTYEIEITATDDTGAATSQLFLVHVENADDSPSAIDDQYSILEGGTFTEDVTLNDFDPENSSFTVTIVNPPNYGSAFVDADGKVVYQHDGGEESEERFVYQITDAGGNVSNATVVVTINPVEDATLVIDDQIAAAFESSTIIRRNTILANDIDPDTQPDDMSITVTKLPDHGVIQMVNGQLVFTPSEGFVGNDSIEYQVEAGGEVSNTGVVVIVVGGSTGSSTKVDEATNADEETELEDLVSETGGDGSTNNDTSEDPQDETKIQRAAPTGFADKLANAFGRENETSENSIGSNEFDIELSGATYAYASRNEELSLTNLAEIFVSSRSNEQIAEFETTLLAGLLWEDLDSANREFMDTHQLQLGVNEIAASAASFLTVGYLAWIIRGGVLLTTFMSSIPTWSVFDIQSLIESGGRDESIEQIVDQ